MVTGRPCSSVIVVPPAAVVSAEAPAVSPPEAGEETVPDAPGSELAGVFFGLQPVSPAAAVSSRTAAAAAAMRRIPECVMVVASLSARVKPPPKMPIALAPIKEWGLIPC